MSIVARVWMLADPCADPGIFGRGVQARLPENSSDNVFFLFCPQFLLFYSGLLMVYFKENYSFTRFQGWGRVSKIFQEGPTFSSEGSNFFQGVGRGVQMLIIETHRTCDFPGGGCEPSISLPSRSAHVTI